MVVLVLEFKSRRGKILNIFARKRINKLLRPPSAGMHNSTRVDGWPSPPHLVFRGRGQVGSTCSRVRQQQRELLLRRERRVKLIHYVYVMRGSVGD